jgi:autotransporter family porin
VRRSSQAFENKSANLPFNHSRKRGLAEDFFTPGSGDACQHRDRAGEQGLHRHDGRILQWVACKWGIDEDLVRAQAALESWWHQDAKGDWGGAPERCPPGHGLGIDGEPGLCPESWGLLQNRYPYEQSAWPGMADSSAFNADTAYAIWRACFEGYEWWLNDVERGEEYVAGDAWGCIGRWFAGRWHTPLAEEYIGRVEETLNARIWEQPDFQEP